MAFKIALTAGHYMGTPGKRCLKKLDPNETREWWLNDRIADKVQNLLKDYTGYELLRTDDTSGKKDVSLRNRTNAANKFKADFYLSIHHNAGIKGGSGGGITAFVYTNAKSASIDWQKALYKALIDDTGLKGNRATPMPKKNLHEVRETNMPAVLLELGFMDSTTDVPIILTDEYADLCAGAIVKVLVERGRLTKIDKAEETKPVENKEEVCNVNIKVLRKGAKGNEVKALQTLLIGYGYSCGSAGVDGSFGSATENAVKSYQNYNGLDVDGVSGPKTWAKLLGVS